MDEVLSWEELGDETRSNLLKKVDRLDLSNRTVRRMPTAGVRYIGDLVQKHPLQLLEIGGFGQKCLDEVVSELAAMDLRLGMIVDGWPPESLVASEEITTGAEREGVDGTAWENLDDEIRQNLLKEVNRLDWSKRTLHRMPVAGVTYIGDLVHMRPGQLLDIDGFGRKSLDEVVSELAAMDLDLGMTIDGWPPQNLEALVEQANGEGFGSSSKRTGMAVEPECLDDEVNAVFTLVDSERNRKVVELYLGRRSNVDATLQDIGDLYGITRERIRQIVSRFTEDVARIRPSFRLLKDTLEVLRNEAPANTARLETLLIERGMVRERIPAKFLLKLAEVGNLDVPVSIESLGFHSFVVRTDEPDVPKRIISMARRHVSRRGVTNVEDVVRDLEIRLARAVDEAFVREVLEAHEEYSPLADAWFWFPSVGRNRLKTIVRKVLSVADRIRVDRLRDGIRRTLHMNGFAPPRQALLEFCRQAGFCQVEGEYVSASTPIPWESLLEGAERDLVSILRDHERLLCREDFERLCLERGVNQTTFSIYMGNSPVIERFAWSVYGLRGLDPDPTLLATLSAQQTRERALLDHGLLEDGRYWIAHRLSRGTFSGGVLSIPAALHHVLHGEFGLLDTDGRAFGTLRLRDSSAWGFGRLLTTYGAEEGDELALVFDLEARTVTAHVGGDDLEALLQQGQLPPKEPAEQDDESEQELMPAIVQDVVPPATFDSSSGESEPNSLAIGVGLGIEALGRLGAQMARRAVLLDCSGVDILFSEQLEALLGPLPRDWNFADLNDVVDVETVSDGLARQIEQWFDPSAPDVASVEESSIEATKNPKMSPAIEAGKTEDSAITAETLVEAMEAFDAISRNQPKWKDWESSRGFPVAIEHAGRRYPLQEIVRMAGGVYVSNSDRARELVGGLGFRTRYLSTRGSCPVDRTSVDEARSIVEGFYPDEAIRSAVVNLVVEAIEAAHSQNANSWEITLDRSYILMSVSGTFVIQLTAGFVDVLLDRTRLNQKVSLVLEGHGDRMKRDKSYREAPNSDCWKFPSFSALDFALSVVIPLKSTARQIAGRCRTRARYWASHSTGMVDYAAEVTERALAQPAYVDSEDWPPKKA